MFARRIVAIALLAAAPVAAISAAAPAASARAKAPSCPGRILLATEHQRPSCTVRPNQRLDLLIEATDLSHAFDTCAAEGGYLRSAQIHRMPQAFGGLARNLAFVRCYDAGH